MIYRFVRAGRGPEVRLRDALNLSDRTRFATRIISSRNVVDCALFLIVVIMLAAEWLPGVAVVVLLLPAAVTLVRQCLLTSLLLPNPRQKHKIVFSNCRAQCISSRAPHKKARHCTNGMSAVEPCPARHTDSGSRHLPPRTNVTTTASCIRGQS